MKVVVVGGSHPKEKPSESMGSSERYFAHSICGSTLGIAEGLSSGSFDAVPFDNLRDPIEADALFVSEWNLFDYVADAGIWDFSKPTVLLLHHPKVGPKRSPSELYAMTDGHICFTREEALSRFKEENGGDGYWVAEWGVPNWWRFPPEMPCPYLPESRNIVYAGRLSTRHRVLDRILGAAKLFPEATVWVIANIEPGSEEIEGVLRSRKNIRFLGRKAHGTFLNYLFYASAALDSGVDGMKLANNCKIWDYLAAGVPVVIDGESGGTELIEKTGGGWIVPRNDTDAYFTALDNYLSRPPAYNRRIEVSDWMMANYSWTATVSRWIDRFREAVT